MHSKISKKIFFRTNMIEYRQINIRKMVVCMKKSFSQNMDLGQVFRHIFLRIYIFLSKLRLGVAINIKENL